jgi:hypothetical protein
LTGIFSEKAMAGNITQDYLRLVGITVSQGESPTLLDQNQKSKKLNERR